MEKKKTFKGIKQETNGNYLWSSREKKPVMGWKRTPLYVHMLLQFLFAIFQSHTKKIGKNNE